MISKKADRSLYKTVTINLSKYEWNQFIKLREHGFSAREVLEHSSCPCEKCKNINVVVFDKNTGEEITIPRGILVNRR